ncbi:hypothetical protein Cgig2_021385 [Carnegiea gigantea]|uniref:Uncharacterized protein n=1 Tax=Carnegiea gigantea TaxID=171969 RepID=A0A9Q1KDS8_9CARY|nr:hypothetical protein Cgig2_021385 [Carnegiea gigantea]
MSGVLTVDDDCGFFKWDKDEEFSMVERNKILEERIEELVSDMQRMDCQLTKLKSNDQCNNNRVGANDILREEVTNLKIKIAKEKQRRGTIEDKLKAARDKLPWKKGAQFAIHRPRNTAPLPTNEQSPRRQFMFTLRIYAVNEVRIHVDPVLLSLLILPGMYCAHGIALFWTTKKHDVLNSLMLQVVSGSQKSLSCPVDVIFVLAKKQSHVPFRNLKLTFLTIVMPPICCVSNLHLMLLDQSNFLTYFALCHQPCLREDSKNLMFVNLSPKFSSVNESLCSL